jgi:hypothetical protein
MSTSAKERIQVHHQLSALGLGYYEANQLRRISMTLKRWFELECGCSNNHCSWAIERNEVTEKPYFVRHFYDMPKADRQPIPDREKGARKRLAKLMEQFPDLTYYIQTDPRGCALYVLKKSDVNGHDIEQVYSRGVAVY